MDDKENDQGNVPMTHLDAPPTNVASSQSQTNDSYHQILLKIQEITARMATKEDIDKIREEMATKEEIAKIREEMATKKM